jgi:hypothetical protein
VGDQYTFNVTVTSPAGTPAATGTVRLAPVPPTTLPGYTCTATVIAGRGSCTVKPSEFGIDKYKATYTGNAAHFGSASDGKFDLAAQNVTKTTVTPATATPGSVTLTATVVAMGANISAPAGTGSVAFYNGPNVIAGCAAKLLTYAGGGNNVATCTVTLAAGTYHMTAVYSGDPVNVASTSPDDVLVVS